MDHVINLTNDAADSRLYAIPDGRNRVLNGIHHTRDIAADAVPDTRHNTLDGIQHGRYNRFDIIPDFLYFGTNRIHRYANQDLNSLKDCLK